jgi:hypothetical protein
VVFIEGFGEVGCGHLLMSQHMEYSAPVFVSEELGDLWILDDLYSSNTLAQIYRYTAL